MGRHSNYRDKIILFMEFLASVMLPESKFTMAVQGWMDSSANVFISEVRSDVIVVSSARPVRSSVWRQRVISSSQERFTAKMTVL